MVVSSVVPATLPALIQLPAVTSVRLMRPEMGAAIVANERSSSADLTLASDTFTAAWASRRSDMRSSKVLSEMILRSISGWPRATSRLAFSTLVVAANSSARACSSARSNGRGSMANSNVALLDQLAVLEAHLVEIARDARPYLDDLHRIEATGVLVPLDDLALRRLGDGDRRCRRPSLLLGRLWLSLIAACQWHRQGSSAGQHP